MNAFPDVHRLQLEHISALFVWGLAGRYRGAWESRVPVLLEAKALH